MNGKIEFILYIIYIGLTIYYLGYHIYCYIKKNLIYTKKDRKLSVVNDRYYLVQLILGILTCVILAIGGSIVYNKLAFSLFISYYLCMFWILDYLGEFIALEMNYLKK